MSHPSNSQHRDQSAPSCIASLRGDLSFVNSLLASADQLRIRAASDWRCDLIHNYDAIFDLCLRAGVAQPSSTERQARMKNIQVIEDDAEGTARRIREKLNDVSDTLVALRCTVEAGQTSQGQETLEELGTSDAAARTLQASEENAEHRWLREQEMLRGEVTHRDTAIQALQENVRRAEEDFMREKTTLNEQISEKDTIISSLQAHLMAAEEKLAQEQEEHRQKEAKFAQDVQSLQQWANNSVLEAHTRIEEAQRQAAEAGRRVVDAEQTASEALEVAAALNSRISVLEDQEAQVAAALATGNYSLLVQA